MRRRFLPAPVLLSVLAAPGILVAQGQPVGPEFRVNSYTTGNQVGYSVASDPAGNFIVVWHSNNQDGNGYGVFAQRYASTGAPLGGEIRVNTYTTSHQRFPSVASDSSGNFVVAWSSLNQDGSEYGIFAQRYDNTGTAVGVEFRVNSYTTSRQWTSAVASDPAGNFVVAWTGFAYQDGWGLGVFAQRYASTGIPLGSEFQVNTFTPYHQSGPSAAFNSAGNFIVTWSSTNQEPGASNGVFAQRYASSGAPTGGEFHVNTHITGNQFWAPLAFDSAEDFVIVWQSDWQDGSLGGVFAQRWASTGAPLGAEFRVNTQVGLHQGHPAVASDLAGNFVVVWESENQDGSGMGVFAQRYDSTGAPLGGEFRVNTYTKGFQGISGSDAAVASDSAGNFVVVWTSTNQDGSGSGVFAQRYNMIVPVALQDFHVE